MYNISLVYFSPTGTTSRIMKEIISGLNMPVVQSIDLTRAEVRDYDVYNIAGDILLLGVPVYRRTIPDLVRRTISSFQIKGKYIILVTTYGGINAGNALNDLSDLIDLQNNHLLAAAEFVSSHSFLLSDIPASNYRPDELDLGTARDFGYRLRRILDDGGDINVNKIATEKNDINLPDKKRKKLASLFPKKSIRNQISIIRDSEKICRNCLLCVNCCPVAAIDAASFSIDQEKCLNCCACVQKCPQQVWYIVRSGKMNSYLLKKSGSDRLFPRIYL